MAKSGGTTQTAKIAAMVDALGWDASLEDCAKYLKDTFSLELENAYISQLRSNERKKRGLPALRTRKGSKRKAAKVAKAEKASSPATPAAVSKKSTTATATEITEFVLEITKWKERIGSEAIQEVLTTMANK